MTAIQFSTKELRYLERVLGAEKAEKLDGVDSYTVYLKFYNALREVLRLVDGKHRDIKAHHDMIAKLEAEIKELS